jgi:signal peptidase II
MGRGVLSPRRVGALFWATFCVVLLLDQLTKALVRDGIDPGESIPVWDGVFHLTRVTNEGAAFGFFQGGQLYFSLVGVAVLVAIAIFWWRSRPEGRLLALVLGLLGGGAAGNFIDRAFVGGVTDFLDFRVWPVFNVADSAAVVGSIALAAWMLFSDRPESEQ